MSTSGQAFVVRGEEAAIGRISVAPRSRPGRTITIDDLPAAFDEMRLGSGLRSIVAF